MLIIKQFIDCQYSSYNMLTAQERQRSKSSKRNFMKSPKVLKNKFSIPESSPRKNVVPVIMKQSSQKNNMDRVPLRGLPENSKKTPPQSSQWANVENFKNKIMISSSEFNRLKEKLQNTSGSTKGSSARSNKKTDPKKLSIKILDGPTKTQSNKSEKARTIDNSTGSCESEEIEQLKNENEFFKKVFGETMGQLQKLKKSLKQQKRVHDVEKHIYENEINKLKRIVESDRQEEASHIILDEEQNRCIMLLSTLEENGDDGFLGLESDMEDSDLSCGSLSVQSK